MKSYTEVSYRKQELIANILSAYYYIYVCINVYGVY